MNGYLNSSAAWTYITTNPAALYQQSNNTHNFEIAASGTAGNPITWTSAMYINGSGNVGIGTTSPFARLTNYYAYNTAPTLTSGSFAPVSFSNAGVEITMGADSGSPYEAWIQTKNGSAAWNLAINPLGGCVGIGGIPSGTSSASTSTTSGALQVAGGVGVQGNGWFGGSVYSTVTYGSTGAGNIQFLANPASGGAYFAANRASSSTGEVGYGYYTGGSISWLNLINVSDTSLAWYNTSSGTAMKLTTTGILQLFNNGVTYYATPGTFYNQDASTNTIVLANGGTVNFSNFSGFVFVNNNSTAGQTIFCCTGGSVTNFGTGGSNYGAMAGNSSINGYTFTNTTGSSGTFGIYVIRLRQGE